MFRSVVTCHQRHHTIKVAECAVSVAARKVAMNLIVFFVSVMVSVLSTNPQANWLSTPKTPEKVLAMQLVGTQSDEFSKQQQCSDPHLIHCQKSFNKYLGIPSDFDWKIPYYLHDALWKIYLQNGTEGFLTVCRAYTLFAQCLGPMYAACNNPLFYLQHGYNIVSAAFYPAIIAQMHFQCGGGLETAIANWNCLMDTGAMYNETILNCHTEYGINATSDPAHACQYAQKDMQCVRAPFEQNCNQPASWFMCEYTRVGLSAHLPLCNSLRCYVGHGNRKQYQERKFVGQWQKKKSKI